jgi:hypothetical protein
MDELFIKKCNTQINDYCKANKIQSYVAARLRMAVTTALENRETHLRVLISSTLCNRLAKILTNEQYNKLRRRNRYTLDDKNKAISLKEEGLSLESTAYISGCSSTAVGDWVNKKGLGLL